jgi:hypothetical protein
MAVCDTPPSGVDRVPLSRLCRQQRLLTAQRSTRRNDLTSSAAT